MALQISGLADEAGRDVDAQIRAHRELGWTHLDLRTVDGVNVTSVSDAAFEEICRRIETAGLRVANFASGVCCWGRTVKDDFRMDVEELARAIPRMRRLGAATIRVMSCPQPADAEAPEPAYTEEVFRRLRELARMAEAGGVTLVHENVGSDWTRNDPDRMVRLVEAVGSASFRLLFDMGNFGGQTPPEEVLRIFERVRERIAYVHVKDCAPDGRNTWAGEGVVPIREVLRRLVRDGYDGFVSVEPHIAAMHHTGKTAAPDILYATYIRNGRLVSALVREADAGRNKAGMGR